MAKKVTTTVRLDEELYEQLRLHVYSRKMLEPQISISRVVAQALREHFDRAEQGQ